jgi:hypothetical protein
VSSCNTLVLSSSLTFLSFPREEEQEAAKAYAEFVDAFDADSASRSKRGAFVKAGGHEEIYTPTLRDSRERDEHIERVRTVMLYPMLGILTRVYP